MKVLHVIPSLGVSHGGPSQALPLMATGLVRAGCTVDIATTDDDGTARLAVQLGQALPQPGGFTIRYFARQTRFYTSSLPLTTWLRRHVAEYDLLHIHALFSYAAAPAAFWSARRGVPYIVRPLGTLNRWGLENRRPWLKKLSFPLLERRILSSAAAVHYTSEQERAEAAALHPGTSSAVVPLGIDLTPFDQLPSTELFLERHQDIAGRAIVLSLSRLDPKKGLDLLLAAFARILPDHRDAVLVLAGEGEERFVNGLRHRAAALGIEDAVIWPGFLRGEEKLAAFSAASLFVLPSHSENLGIAAVEALAAGLPVVVSNRVGIAPDVERAGAGLVVPPEIEPLAGALAELLSSTNADRGAIGGCARALAGESFSLEASTDGLLDLYRDVLGRCRTGEPRDVRRSGPGRLAPRSESNIVDDPRSRPGTDRPTSSTHVPVSVIVLTFNEERNVDACLASVAGWADEIFVVDSGSTDATREVARQYTEKIVEHQFETYSRQRNWAQFSLPLANDWVFHIDADERVTPELAASIRSFFETGQAERENGALLSRRTVFLGRWIKHGGHYPVYHMRLFRRDRGNCEDRIYHQHFLVPPPIARLEGDLIDIVASDLDSFSLRHLRWAGEEARELTRAPTDRQGQVEARLTGNAVERRRWLRQVAYGRSPLFFRAFGYFLYRYIIRRGFLDGTEGLIFHFLQGCWSPFQVDAKVWEARRAGSTTDEDTNA